MDDNGCKELRVKLRSATATWEHMRQVKAHPRDIALARTAVLKLKRRVRDLCGDSLLQKLYGEDGIFHVQRCGNEIPGLTFVLSLWGGRVVFLDIGAGVSVVRWRRKANGDRTDWYEPVDPNDWADQPLAPDGLPWAGWSERNPRGIYKSGTISDDAIPF